MPQPVVRWRQRLFVGSVVTLIIVTVAAFFTFLSNSTNAHDINDGTETGTPHLHSENPEMDDYCREIGGVLICRPAAPIPDGPEEPDEPAPTTPTTAAPTSPTSTAAPVPYNRTRAPDTGLSSTPCVDWTRFLETRSLRFRGDMFDIVGYFDGTGMTRYGLTLADADLECADHTPYWFARDRYIEVVAEGGSLAPAWW